MSNTKLVVDVVDNVKPAVKQAMESGFRRFAQQNPGAKISEVQGESMAKSILLKVIQDNPSLTAYRGQLSQKAIQDMLFEIFRSTGDIDL